MLNQTLKCTLKLAQFADKVSTLCPTACFLLQGKNIQDPLHGGPAWPLC